HVTVTVSEIAVPLLLSLLLPLAVGLAVRALLPRTAQRPQPFMGGVGTIALAVLVALTVALHFRSILGLRGAGAILASAILVAGAFGIGFLLGENRGVMGLGTGQRNIAAATIVETQSIGNPDTLVMVIVASLVG